MQPRYLHYTDVMLQCYVTFDLALVLVLTFEHLSLGLGLGLELLSLECKPGQYPELIRGSIWDYVLGITGNVDLTSTIKFYGKFNNTMCVIYGCENAVFCTKRKINEISNK